MENATKIRQWSGLVTERSNNVPPVLITGIVLVVVLGGLGSLNPLIGIAGSLMVLLLALTLRRPVLIVYGLALLLPLFGGFARGTLIPFLRIGQAVLVLGCILFVLATPSRQGKSRLTVIDLAFALFFLSEAVFPLLALLYRGEHIDLSSTDVFSGTTALQTLLGPLQYYLLYRVVVATISSERQIITLLKLCFVTSIIVSIIGILQNLGVGPVKTFLATYYPTIDTGGDIIPAGERITSTLESYMGLAAYLCFNIITALACYTNQKQLKISPLLLVATFLIDSIAMILTGTITAMVGLIIGVFVVFKLTRHLPKLIIFALVGGILVAMLIFGPFLSLRLAEWSGAAGGWGVFPTYAERIRLWRELFLPVIGQHLVFGAGPAPAVTAYWPSEETQYLYLLLKGGLLYFFSYILLMGVAIAACWRHIKKSSEGAGRTVAIALLAILVAINIMNVSAEFFTMAGGTQYIWMLLAVVVASRQLEILEASPVASRSPGDKWRAVNMHSHIRRGAAVIDTVGASVTERYPLRGKNLLSSYSLIPNYDGLEVGRLDQPHQRLIRLGHLLDWHFVKDSVVVSASSTIARVLGLLFATLLAHFLTPDDYGFFRYCITLAGIITIVSTASPVSISRFLASHPDDHEIRDRYYSNGLFGIAILLAITLVISVPILLLLHALDIGTISCIVGLTGFYGYLAVVRGLGSAWKMGLTYALSNVALIVALFLILGFFRLRTTTAALVIYGLTNVVQILVLELISPMELRFHLSLISKAVLLEMARFATPIVLATGAYTIWSGIDLLLVENLSPHAAGSYAAAKTLSGAFLFVPAAITMVLMPRVAALRPGKGTRYIAGGVGVALLVSLVGLVIVDLWGHPLITIIFGQRYRDAYFPLLVLSVGMSIYSAYAILEGFLIGRGQPNLSVQALITAVISTGVTCFWLTSWLGPLGASLSFTIGAIIGTAVLLFNTWFFLQEEKRLANSEPSDINEASVATI